jgi:sterol desaturase/sphingolipid hydroxylase (fatty acid hydroxylase superfamily)
MMENEAFYRLSVFAGVFLVMALLELLIPKRGLTGAKLKRWITNVSFGGMNSFFIRLMALSSVPLVAMAVAEIGATQNFGLLRVLDIPIWLSVIIALFVLDFAIYLQHWASHKFSFLWRIHRVHHSDIDIDVTTAIRFHPIEIALSMIYKCALVYLLGINSFAVLLFEIILNGCAMFNHSNIALPGWLDRIIRPIFVTPDMQRVHHSVIRNETDSNYGFNLAIWDRMFGTYIDQPKKGHDKMEIGLPDYLHTNKPTKLTWSFLLPFRK